MNRPSIAEQLKPLLELQEVDAKIHSLQSQLSDWPQKIQALENDLNILTVEKEDLAKQRIDKLMERDRLNQEIQEELEHILAYEKHIREIKSNREYQAMLREVGTSKKAKADAEEAAIEVLEQIEELEQAIAKLDDQIDKKQEELNEAKTAGDEASAAIEQKIAGFKGEQEAVLKQVQTAILSRYRLIQKRHHVVVVAAQDGACTGCHRQIRPQLYNQLLRDEAVVNCPNCHRILITPAAVEVETTPEAPETAE